MPLGDLRIQYLPNIKAEIERNKEDKLARKIIITSDPGQDQAVAILQMLGRPDVFDVLGIVATAGNIGLDYTNRTARQIVELAGRPDIPVYLGSPKPMMRELVTAEHVHGPTGIDGYEMPEPVTPLAKGSGVDFIVETIKNEPPNSVTVVSLSPLTNLGLALKKDPSIATRVQEIVMMAGAYFEVGNITPTAEFNVYVDPEAASVVFNSGAPMTVLPLDVTHKMLASRERLDGFRKLGNVGGAAAHGWMTFSEPFDLQKYGWGAAPLHGPCVPSFILQPEIFSGRNVNISVELNGDFTTGMTVVDFWNITDRPHNVHYIVEGDADRYFDLLTKSLANLP